MQKPLVSIIINNYNYARYLPRAIDSALAQTYSPCEVIVVDDGSTDGSAEVIARFSARIRPLLKENGGQSSALSAGFAASQGEIVVFLDADDLLEPHALVEIVSAFNQQPGLARVQYRLSVIDAQGAATGELKPAMHAPVPSGDITPRTLRFPFDVPWLPTSGNAFSAPALRQVMPIPEEYGVINADYYLVHTTPLFGPVCFLDRVLGCYRVHGENNFERPAAGLDLPRLRSTIVYDELTYAWILRRARQAGLDTDTSLPSGNYSFSTAATRLVSLKLEPQAHPIQGDRLLPLLGLGLRAALGRFDTSPAARAVFAAWLLLAGLGPPRLTRRLAELFFFPERRQGFSNLLGRLHQRRAAAEESR
jgi:glycosyltransferase involved in cell wall biosynthesis